MTRRTIRIIWIIISVIVTISMVGLSVSQAYLF